MQMRKNRCVGLIALLSGLAAPCLWWESEHLVPRATALRHVNGGAMPFFSGDASLFFCGDNTEIRVYDVMRGQRVATWPRSIDSDSVSFGPPFGPVLFAYGMKDEIQFFDAVGGEVVATLSPGLGRTGQVILAPNGKIAFTYHDNQSLRIWKVDTGQRVWEFTFPSSSLTGARFSQDSMRLVVNLRDGTIKILDLSSGQESVRSPSMNRGVFSTFFSPDGGLRGLARLSPDEMGLWDLTNDRLLVQCRLASCTYLGGGSYWCVNHYPYMPLYTLANQIGAAQASRWFLDIHAERRIFDTQTGRLVARIPQAIAGMSPDGTTLATYSREEDSVLLWDVPPASAVHPLFAWASLGLSIVLTRWWWRLRRRGATPADKKLQLTAAPGLV